MEKQIINCDFNNSCSHSLNGQCQICWAEKCNYYKLKLENERLKGLKKKVKEKTCNEVSIDCR